jgi:hypothetical protein
MTKTSEKIQRCLLYPSPGPLTRATLSLQERDSLKSISHFGQQWSMTAHTPKFKTF